MAKPQCTWKQPGMPTNTNDSDSGEVGLGRQTGWEAFKMNAICYKKTSQLQLKKKSTQRDKTHVSFYYFSGVCSLIIFLLHIHLNFPSSQPMEQIKKNKTTVRIRSTIINHSNEFFLTTRYIYTKPTNMCFMYVT